MEDKIADVDVCRAVTVDRDRGWLDDGIGLACTPSEDK